MHNTLGAILARRGDLSGAAAEFSAALDDNPADLSARRNLGLAYLELGRPEDAARELETAVSAHPGYFEARLELGRAYAQQDSTRRAVAAWTSLLALDPPPHVASQAVELLSRYSQEER
jgi:predicted Zn-dependent protease